MSVMPLAPLVGAWLLTQLGGRPAVAVLVALTAGTALIPTLSRPIRSVPKPSQWERDRVEGRCVTDHPATA